MNDTPNARDARDALPRLAVALVALAALSSSGAARADAGHELTLGFGVADRATTSTGTLLGYGYDQSTGPIATLDARLFIDESGSVARYFRHGPVARVSYFAGPTMGADGAAFTNVPIELGYSGRLEMPCLARGDTHFYLQGFLAITGLYADAGRGDRPAPPNTTLARETEVLARTLDHAGLGGALGVGIDVHVGAFAIGLGVDLRQYFGIDTAVARDLIWSGMLRLGVDLATPRD